ncbi:MAG: hypothetical protein LBR21_09810 [Propionibacteriaceae bacterium]|jgi:hypothetical protein|nr:hypothetical protein [Propionibacteriaceae bacterium]
MGRARDWVVGVVSLAVVGSLIAGGVWAYYSVKGEPLPLQPSCTASVGEYSATIDLEQARNAGIIAGVSVKRKLVPRAATIALATAYQESGIRNLDYGHADSLGLFQQRPSQGWGTEEQVQDPWYSSKKFYEALVKVPDWQNSDINDTAQAVQRSGVPDGYRKHESNARALASALTGETPASFTCSYDAAAPNIAGMEKYLEDTYGKRISVSEIENGLSVKADTLTHAWSVAEVAIAAGAGYGLISAELGLSVWQAGRAATWTGEFPKDNTAVDLLFA